MLDGKRSVQVVGDLVEDSQRQPLDALGVVAKQRLQCLEDDPVPDDGPVDAVLAEVDDTAQAVFNDLFPANAVVNLGTVRSLLKRNRFRNVRRITDLQYPYKTDY